MKPVGNTKQAELVAVLVTFPSFLFDLWSSVVLWWQGCVCSTGTVIYHAGESMTRRQHDISYLCVCVWVGGCKGWYENRLMGSKHTVVEDDKKKEDVKMLNQIKRRVFVWCLLFNKSSQWECVRITLLRVSLLGEVYLRSGVFSNSASIGNVVNNQTCEIKKWWWVRICFKSAVEITQNK